MTFYVIWVAAHVSLNTEFRQLGLLDNIKFFLELIRPSLQVMQWLTDNQGKSQQIVM